MRVETKTFPKQAKIYNQTMRALANMTSHLRSITGFETEPQNVAIHFITKRHRREVWLQNVCTMCTYIMYIPLTLEP